MIGRRRNAPMSTFKVLAALLVYPDEELVASLPEMEAILDRERLLPRRDREPLLALVRHLGSADVMDAQALYVSLFDQSRALSLYLFEHIHGESRDRGKAMNDLVEHYRAHGLEMSSAELPDFLPLFLEFLSTQPLDEARRLIAEIVDIVALLRLRLERRRAPYAAAFAALEALSPRRPDEAAIREALGAEKRDDTAEALDASWEDRPVTFGPEEIAAEAGSSCPRRAVPVEQHAVPVAGIGRRQRRGR